MGSSKKSTNQAHNTQEIQEYVRATVSKMMSVYAQATKNSINNTVDNKLKSIKRPSTSTTLTKDKLRSKIKRLVQQLAETTKTGEGIKKSPQNGPEEWQHKNVKTHFGDADVCQR